MSFTKIPVDVCRELWFDAHGRCEFEGCNHPLYEHGVTMDKVNLSQNAHIIADSPKGPRGDEELSSALAKDKSNLMLLCPECHKLIDTNGMVGKYSKEKLRAMKKKHEDRIRMVTGIAPEMKSTVVTYTSNIGKQRIPAITLNDAAMSLFPDYYPSSSDVIDLSISGSALYDNKQTYWACEEEHLRERLNEISRLLDRNSDHISVFAIAPQPLLVLLGSLLGGIRKIRLFQKHRTTEDWKWRPSDTENKIYVERPTDPTGNPVIVFSISDGAIIKRIRTLYDTDSSIWAVFCERPNVEMLDSEDKLNEFTAVTRDLLNEVHEAANGRPVKIHMAMPVAMAIALGRARLPKASPEWELFDYRDGIDAKVLTIK